MLRRATEEGTRMEQYVGLELDVISFEEDDIITTSGDLGPFQDWTISE